MPPPLLPRLLAAAAAAAALPLPKPASSVETSTSVTPTCKRTSPCTISSGSMRKAPFICWCLQMRKMATDMPDLWTKRVSMKMVILI